MKRSQRDMLLIHTHFSHTSQLQHIYHECVCARTHTHTYTHACVQGHVRKQQKLYESKGERSREKHRSADILISDSKSPKLWEKKCLLFTHPICDTLLWQLWKQPNEPAKERKMHSTPVPFFSVVSSRPMPVNGEHSVKRPKRRTEDLAQ